MRLNSTNHFYSVSRKLRTLRNILFVLFVSRFSKDITKLHFETWSTLTHPNYNNFSRVIALLEEKPVNILETGTSAWGTDSTRLWDLYVRRFGGHFISVDLRREASRRLMFQVGKDSRLETSDSVKFIENYRGPQFDFVYLDSWDVDPANPLAAALHGLAEFEALSGHLNSGCLVLIDDTPTELPNEDYVKFPALEKFRVEYQQTPGKGALILSNLNKYPNFKILSHDYSLLLQFN